MFFLRKKFFFSARSRCSRSKRRREGKKWQSLTFRFEFFSYKLLFFGDKYFKEHYISVSGERRKAMKNAPKLLQSFLHFSSARLRFSENLISIANLAKNEPITWSLGLFFLKLKWDDESLTHTLQRGTRRNLIARCGEKCVKRWKCFNNYALGGCFLPQRTKHNFDDGDNLGVWNIGRAFCWLEGCEESWLRSAGFHLELSGERNK